MPQANTNTFSPVAFQQEHTRTIPALHNGSAIAVVGAGAFGSWSALYLLRKGYKVTLIDSWGPGHSRSSSGDETRVIRSTYGANELYFNLNVKALTLWNENEKIFKKKLFNNTGVLWFCYDEKTPIVDDSISFTKAHRMEYEYLSNDELKKRFPLVQTTDLHHAYLDPYGGYLMARESVKAVSEAFVREGGHYMQAEAKPGKIIGNNLSSILLSNGQSLHADAYIFSCGAWLGKIFPEVLGKIINCTKQEVYYFGAPAQQSKAYEDLPVWVDVDGKDFYYGIPGNSHRGFKVGVDIRGEVFDPTDGERTYNHETLSKARKFLAHRFPGLKNAPLLESRVCPYENSPDGNFIFDLLPETTNAFILGGGSGHGFKHSPALGQMVAEVMTGAEKIPSLFLLRY